MLGSSDDTERSESFKVTVTVSVILGLIVEDCGYV